MQYNEDDIKNVFSEDKKDDVIKKLKELSKAYKEALEHDAVQSGKYEGYSPRNLIEEIIIEIGKL